MGFSKKHQVDGDSIEGKIWVISGLTTMCAPLKSVSINGEYDESLDSGSTTPTKEESRVPEKFRCPPPPRKRRPVSNCQRKGDVEYFTSPELDSFFEHFANSERGKCIS
ncbi:putative cyclin-dependent protein kinase inhibitor SMR [Helianthus annuus]|nr:putative cyclin-dependent protein kinase inhibitor SMR [Helianthus annuus]